MINPPPEQRSVRRFPLDLPLCVKFSAIDREDAACRTRDVSSRGVFFYASSDMAKDSAVEFVMTLPREITLAGPIRVHCQGKIVRVDQSNGHRGVAVAIDKYDFVHKE
ncbi:MAG TPA: PilZ domain-containing protein [Verrucomicrobiae bacterium]|jgi:hypothetical protein|nr:PilZ domain-containing protein [Verrucomicrobiae bacterium]